VTANSLKLLHGGLFPILLAAAIAFLMLTWWRGQHITEQVRSSLRESEQEFFANLLVRPLPRLPGTAAFLTSATVGIPVTLTLHLKHIYALHERVLLVTVVTSEDSHVPENVRAKMQDLPGGFYRVTLDNGFMETPSVPEGLRMAVEQAQLNWGNLSAISYYIGSETMIRPGAEAACGCGGSGCSHSCCTMPSEPARTSTYRRLRSWKWASRLKSEPHDCRCSTCSGVLPPDQAQCLGSALFVVAFRKLAGS
jgi:K+ transporter